MTSQDGVEKPMNLLKQFYHKCGFWFLICTRKIKHE